MAASDIQPIPMYAKAVAALITLVVSGYGALAFVSQYDPGRWTRFGFAGPFEGHAAQHLGLVIFVLGLMPLGFFARSARQAGYFCSAIGVLTMVCLVGGLWLIR